MFCLSLLRKVRWNLRRVRTNFQPSWSSLIGRISTRLVTGGETSKSITHWYIWLIERNFAQALLSREQKRRAVEHYQMHRRHEVVLVGTSVYVGCECFIPVADCVWKERLWSFTCLTNNLLKVGKAWQVKIRSLGKMEVQESTAIILEYNILFLTAMCGKKSKKSWCFGSCRKEEPHSFGYWLEVFNVVWSCWVQGITAAINPSVPDRRLLPPQGENRIPICTERVKKRWICTKLKQKSEKPKKKSENWPGLMRMLRNAHRLHNSILRTANFMILLKRLFCNPLLFRCRINFATEMGSIH